MTADLPSRSSSTDQQVGEAAESCENKSLQIDKYNNAKVLLLSRGVGMKYYLVTFMKC